MKIYQIVLSDFWGKRQSAILGSYLDKNKATEACEVFRNVYVTTTGSLEVMLQEIEVIE